MQLTNQLYSTTILASIRSRMLSQVTKQLKTVKGTTCHTSTTGRFELATGLKAMELQQVPEMVSKVRSLTGILA